MTNWESTTMVYRIKYEASFYRDFKKLNIQVQKRIANWIEKHLYNSTDPRLIGKPLVGSKKGWWRYRIGDYRLIVEINDDELLIIAVDIGHRRDIYR